MKKLVFLISVILMSGIAGGACADGIVSEYTYDEEYKNIMDDGYEYLGYSGVLSFTADFAEGVDYAGCVFERCEGYYFPMDMKLIGKNGTNNYMLRIGGRGLKSGEYTLTPYAVVKGNKIKGDPVLFKISESCEAMTNLRIAYDQVSKIEFEEHEKKLMDIVMPDVAATIKAGENGTEISKKYVETVFAKDIAEAKNMYKNVFTSEQQKVFNRKIDTVDKTARAFLIVYFSLY